MNVWNEERLKSAAADGPLRGKIVLDGAETYHIDAPLVLTEPVEIDGQGAHLTGKALTAVYIHSGGVTLKNIVLDGFEKSVEIDAKGKTIRHILLSHVDVNDPGYGVVFNIGSTENDSHIEDLHFEDCILKSAYEEDRFLKQGMVDGATAFMVCAASPSGTRTQDICNCTLDGLYIERCEAYGGRRYGVNMLAGIILPVEGYDYYDQKARVVDCTIKNVKILDSVFDYCREMAITLSCGTIMNYGSLFENLEVARCRVVYGIAGIGYSAAGPVVPNSVARSMGVRHGTIHDNILRQMDLPVNEPNMAIGLTAGRAESIGGIECYDAFVEDVQIYNNTVENGMVGISIVTANTLTDEECTLSGNTIKDVDIYNNTLNNCKLAFFFTAAYAEGRRFDYDWGWYHKDQPWAPLAQDHRVQTVRFTDNRIEDLACHDNTVNGCKYEVVAAGGCGRGHAVMKGNTVSNGIRYEHNTFNRSEGHVIVQPVFGHDWVSDDGGNKVEAAFKYPE